MTDGKGKLTGPADAEGHRAGGAEPAGLQGPAGPVAGGGGDHGGRCRVRAVGGADRCRLRSDRDRHGAWPFRRRGARGGTGQEAVERGAGGGRQRRHRRGDARADRRGRGCGEGRDRAGLDLHHADGGGRRRAAADRDHGLRGGGGRRAGDRGWRHQVLGRFRQGDRGGRILRDGRQHDRRHRREARAR